MPARETICNLAIAKIKAKAIASYDEDSLEARECRRFYPEVVKGMLEGPEEWQFATRRVVLAAKATNDRTQEWVYAYSVPSDMARAIRVLPNFDALGVQLPIALPGDPYAEAWALPTPDFATHYEISNDTLYSNVGQATLEYTINDITGVTISAKVQQALAIELGAHLAVPVKGDSAREKELLQMVETAWERAIAEHRNRQPVSYPNYVSEVLAARRGVDIG